MNFNSLEYGVFLMSVVVAYWMVVRSVAARHLVLLIASYLFYMTWSIEYAGLIFFSTIVDYFIGRLLGNTQSNRGRVWLLIISLTTNLGLLFVFKYFNFFVETGEQAATLFGLDLDWTRSPFLLPVGISFYTFQTLSYTIDIYRRRLEPERDFVRFAIFVSFFPQLVAGPIVRAIDFLPQLRSPPANEPSQFHAGMLRIFQGLFKKVVIADLLAHLLVDKVFASPDQFGAVDNLLALYGYAFQIYNDFSGYTDIAIGSAILLGFKLPENFRQPYLASDVREFWSRWHISLSTWLRDYLYIPLGGSRLGERRTTINLMLTMLLGGLWHGAEMKFVLWGLFHGILLILAHHSIFVGKKSAWSVFRCFHLVVFGWLLFRVESMQHLNAFFGQLYSGWGMPIQASSLFIAVLGLAFAEHLLDTHWVANARRWVAESSPSIFLGFFYAASILILVATSVDSPSFLYFQF